MTLHSREALLTLVIRGILATKDTCDKSAVESLAEETVRNFELFIISQQTKPPLPLCRTCGGRVD